MDTTPYQLPINSSHGSDPVDISAEGIWQDGRYLVLSVIHAQFPLRCVKTNQPVSELTSERINWIPMPLLLKLFVGFLFAKLLWGKSIDVKVGLSGVIRRKRRWIVWSGWGLAVGGIVGLILFTFIYIAAMVSGVKDTSGNALMLVPLVLSSIALAGIPVLVVGYIPELRVKKWSGDQLWISGVHSEFLRTLPPWTRE